MSSRTKCATGILVQKILVFLLLVYFVDKFVRSFDKLREHKIGTSIVPKISAKMSVRLPNDLAYLIQVFADKRPVFKYPSVTVCPNRDFYHSYFNMDSSTYDFWPDPEPPSIWRFLKDITFSPLVNGRRDLELVRKIRIP